MEDVVTLVIHHGGRVVWQDEYVPQYIGGSTFQMHIFKEEITYERLHQIARWELQYESADRMFYLPHGQNMSNGMVEIFSEMSVSHGLLYSGIDGVITVYMTCIVNDEEFAGDNMTKKCGCRLYASWYGRNRAIVIKSMGLPHSCTRSLRMKQMTARWIAKTYLERFRGNQIVDSSALAAEIKKTYSVEVTTRTCYRAKMYAKRLIEGTIMESYGKLRSYILELKRADPRGRFILEVDPTPNGDHVLFKRFFVGFSCLREGFLSACRPMFAMDGCFLKGEIKGMLLAAVGKDGNNQMFPICWVVVEGENKDYWNWFLEVVQEELHLGDGSGWSIISDQQKVSVCVH
ncbi:hypothetical protein LINGRAHAP2_LOCUS25324 [Linum grandiflorum]